MKRIIVTGNGKSGSYMIRGAQLGKAIGAEVVPKATSVDADIVVVVKRFDPAMRRNGAKLVWDVVDSWPQPNGVNNWDRRQCLKWLADQVAAIKPHAIVAATQKMAADLADVFDGPILALPHHARPHQVLNPICHKLCIVGYEGSAAYLGSWAFELQAECKRRGWAFVTNPVRLAHLDAVVAVRASQGYASLNHKSNVKLANAQGSGTPFIGNREAGYLETDTTHAAHWADNMAEMRRAFDALEDDKVRQQTAIKLLAAAPKLEAVAETYRAWLETL